MAGQRKGNRATQSQDLLPEEMRIVETLLTEKASLKSALGAARQALGNPIIVSNRALRVIGHTDDDPDDRVWHQTIDSQHVPLLEEGFTEEYRNVMSSGAPVITTMPSQQNRTMLCPLTFGGDSYGFTAVFECYRDFGENDERILSTFSKTAARIVYEKLLTGTFKKEPHEQLLADLIDGYDLGDEGFNRMRELFGLHSVNRMMLLLVKPESNRRNSHVLPLVKFELETILDLVPNVIVNESALCILDADRLDRSGDDFLNKLESFCAERDLCACLSRPFEPFRETKTHYQMVHAALELKSQMGDLSPRVVRYDDYMPYHLLEQASHNYDLRTFVAPEVQRLVEYDRKNKGEMTATLAAFYKNACDVTKTAQALHLHYNTVDYRLRRIEDICGVDIRDASRTLALRVSLITVGYLRAQNTSS